MVDAKRHVHLQVRTNLPLVLHIAAERVVREIGLRFGSERLDKVVSHAAAGIEILQVTHGDGAHQPGLIADVGEWVPLKIESDFYSMLSPFQREIVGRLILLDNSALRRRGQGGQGSVRPAGEEELSGEDEENNTPVTLSGKVLYRIVECVCGLATSGQMALPESLRMWLGVILILLPDFKYF